MAAAKKLNSRTLQALAHMVEKKGLTGAAQALGVGREALARALAGVPIRRGTVALLERAVTPRQPKDHAA